MRSRKTTHEKRKLSLLNEFNHAIEACENRACIFTKIKIHASTLRNIKFV